MHLYNGQAFPFNIVSFPDGSMPNAQPVKFLNIILVNLAYLSIFEA